MIILLVTSILSLLVTILIINNLYIKTDNGVEKVKLPRILYVIFFILAITPVVNLLVWLVIALSYVIDHDNYEIKGIAGKIIAFLTEEV